MKGFLTSASHAVVPGGLVPGGLVPGGLGSMWKWLIAGALTFGIGPVSVQAQNVMGPGPGQTGSIAPATLFGLPAKNGRVHWPAGLQTLPPADETRALRDQFELILYFVATQTAEGQGNRAFIDLGLQAVCDLRELLRPHEGTMPAVTYAEAMRFLDRAERGLTKIKMIDTSSGGASP